jgi:4,5-DOPA dioxygenase extradiol
MSKKLPAIFLAHGSPMNAILENDYTRVLKKLGKEIEKPKAILVISAHWQTRQTYITIDDAPNTIYDFYGFPDELYKIKYNSIGSKKYAQLILNKFKNIKGTTEWGLDHASWTVLKHMYPEANIPVIEMSLNVELDERGHYNLGKSLSSLREEGILIIGSGNIVHNLMKMDYDMYGKPFESAVKFDSYIKQALDERNHERLVNYNNAGVVASLAVPTKEHYLPLLYVAALQEEDEEVSYIYEDIQHGSMAMRSFIIGG